MPAKTNFEAMLAAANKEEENKEAIVALEKTAAAIHEATQTLETTKAEIVTAKENLKLVKDDLQEASKKLALATVALNAAAASCDNTVGGIAKAIVDAEQSTVHVGIKDGDMEKLNTKLVDYLGQVQQITKNATFSQIQEFQNQRRNAHDQYKEWDGIWFGRYSQWFFMTFFTLGFGAFVLMIVLASVGK